MIISADQYTCFVFDLDDTLYHEIDYLKSAYHYIASEVSAGGRESVYEEMLRIFSMGGNAFKFILNNFPEQNLTQEKLLYLYRNHNPDISLREGVLEMLIKIKKRHGKIGIITDGRSITQRNKIKALGLTDYIDKMVISEEIGCEKPAPFLYESFMSEGLKSFYYFGDNISKDFISPKKLSWCCVGILDKRNIHTNDLAEFSNEYLPHFFIRLFTEIEII